MTLKTRRPTGKPPWPMLLLAGTEKAGKSYACAQASASAHVGRTFWIGVGEDDPDEYGALDGARFEIVEHDGTYRAILSAIESAVAVPMTDGKPNLIVVDSIGRLWELLSDMAQVEANRRKKRDEAVITMDQWNLAKQRWAHVITALKEHNGPVIVTSRMEKVTVLGEDGQPAKDARGNPTGEKIFKVKAEKSLPFDVGAIVELHARGEYWLTGVRSLKFKPEPGVAVPYPDFTVEKLWHDLGVTAPGATAPRQVSHLDSDPEAEKPVDPILRAAQIELWNATEDHGSSDERTATIDRVLREAGTTMMKANVSQLRAAITKLDHDATKAKREPASQPSTTSEIERAKAEVQAMADQSLAQGGHDY